MSTNIGKASVEVKLLDTLPNITKDFLNYDFDISANQWAMFNQTPNLSPFLIENSSEDISGFATLYPSRRKHYIDNYITDGSTKYKTTITNPDAPYILLQPIQQADGFVADLLDTFKFNADENKYNLLYPGDYPNDSAQYLGPKWYNSMLSQDVQDNDLELTEKILSHLRRKGSNDDNDDNDDNNASDAEEQILPHISYVTQTVVRDGLWWGLESNSFLYENMPFWITIKRSRSPSTSKYPTFLIISLGVESTNNAFDIYLSNDKKPSIITYYRGRDKMNYPSTDSQMYYVKTYESDLSKIFSTDEDIEIGIMSVGSRIIITINKNTIIFYRILGDNKREQESKILPTVISPGKIRIYGSNSQLSINVSPMNFANLGFFSPLVIVPGDKPSEDKNSEPERIEYGYFDNEGLIRPGPCCIIPSNSSDKKTLYGVDCETFFSDAGNAHPSGQNFNKKGYIYFKRASDMGFYLDNNDIANDYYILFFKPLDTIMRIDNREFVIPRGGCPYFFRIKGGYYYAQTDLPGIEHTDISSDVISVSESFQMDDYFIVNGSADVVLYNKNGKYDYLKDTQRGISIGWRWTGYDFKQTFLGVVLNVSISEKPGKEEITLRCKDYCFILKNFRILNSPFYDGMVAFYAIKDIVKRSGIIDVINEWTNTREYFLKSGFIFTSPVFKFPDQQSLYECIKAILQLYEATLYFDQYGDCKVRKLPGGIFSSLSNENIAARFTRNPDEASQGTASIINDEKNIEYDYESTVNSIIVSSLHRDNRDPILENKIASSEEDKLLYRSVFYTDEGALGSRDVVTARLDELAQRLFYIIKAVSFKTIGNISIIYPGDFITIDGDEYRLMALNRKYDATNNSFITDYNAEWLGGKQYND